MKVLFLVQKEQRAILDRLYDGIAAHCECDTRWLSSEEQADLRGYFRKHVDVSRYDRILFFLRFKKEMRQVRFIRSVPNLVILEHDAYQNYIPCKYTRQVQRPLPAPALGTGDQFGPYGQRTPAPGGIRRGIRAQGLRPDPVA